MDAIPPARVYRFSDYLKQGAHFAALGGLVGVVGYVSSPIVFIAGILSSTGVAVAARFASRGISYGDKVRSGRHFELRKAIGDMSKQVRLRRSIRLQSLGTPEDKRFQAKAMGLDEPQIAMSEPLLNTRGLADQKAIAAHEIVHIAAGHVSQKVSSFAMVNAPLVAGVTSLATGSPKAGAVALVAYGASFLVEKSLHRRQETQSDRGIGLLGADPLAMIGFLKDAAATDQADRSLRAELQDWQTGSPTARLFKIAISPLKSHPHISRRNKWLARQAAAQGRAAAEIAAAVARDGQAAPPLWCNEMAGLRQREPGRSWGSASAALSRTEIGTAAPGSSRRGLPAHDV